MEASHYSTFQDAAASGTRRTSTVQYSANAQATYDAVDCPSSLYDEFDDDVEIADVVAATKRANRKPGLALTTHRMRRRSKSLLIPSKSSMRRSSSSRSSLKSTTSSSSSSSSSPTSSSLGLQHGAPVLPARNMTHRHYEASAILLAKTLNKPLVRPVRNFRCSSCQEPTSWCTCTAARKTSVPDPITALIRAPTPPPRTDTLTKSKARHTDAPFARTMQGSWPTSSAATAVSG